MSADRDQRLHRLLGGEDLADLRRRLRRRFEQEPESGSASKFQLADLKPHELDTLGGLMGRRPRGTASVMVDLDEIDAALARADLAATLRDALERLDGPLVHRPTARASREAAWAAVAAGARTPALAALLSTPGGLGLLKRLARQDTGVAHRLCEAADAVLARLPAAGLPRAQLAAECLGDAHALDDGRPVATLVLAARRTEAEDDDPEEKRRVQWARAGVLVNELARATLLLNVPAERALAPDGEPFYASLRLLLRDPPRWRVSGRTVFVCENPNIVAIAADRLGPRAGSLVCTDGMPAAAQRTLLAQLGDAGAALLYHGDFDWPGLTIANMVISTFAARPWRFSAADYAKAAPRLPDHGQRLKGRPVAANWDAALAKTMAAHDRPVPEETVAEDLLSDLVRE